MRDRLEEPLQLQLSDRFELREVFDRKRKLSARSGSAWALASLHKRAARLVTVPIAP